MDIDRPGGPILSILIKYRGIFHFFSPDVCLSVQDHTI